MVLSVDERVANNMCDYREVAATVIAASAGYLGLRGSERGYGRILIHGLCI